MTPPEIKELLRDPSLLNLVCGLAALNRIYEGMAQEASYVGWGHFVTILIYLAGFLLGLAEVKSRAWRKASYALLGIGSSWLLFCVWHDLPG